MANPFYAYTHARPDGSVFYIGKGRGRRATSFSPSRRSAHHVNIVQKYGAPNILVTIYPCASEEEAFALECQMIAEARAAGVELLNLTDGGEGVSGREMPPAAREAFKKWQGAYKSLSPDAQQRILDGLARGRATRAANLKTPEGRAREAARPRLPKVRKYRRAMICKECTRGFYAQSPKAVFCHTTCHQRWLRKERGQYKGTRPMLLKLADLGDRAVERAGSTKNDSPADARGVPLPAGP